MSFYHIILMLSFLVVSPEKKETKTEKQKNKLDFLTVEIVFKHKTYSNFVFDTGAEGSILAEEIAEEINLSRRLIFLKDSFPPPPLVYKSIKIPFLGRVNIGYRGRTKIFLNKQNCTGKNKFFWSKRNMLFRDSNISGILGWNFIKKYNWIIDAKHNNIKKYDSLNTEISDDYIILSADIKEKEGLPSIDLLINRAFNFNVIFDTGAKHFISIGNNIFKKKEQESNASTFYGVNEEKYVLLDSININGLLFRNTPVGIYSHMPSFRGLAGLDFMRLFDKVIIDNRNNKILFCKKK